MTDRGSMTPARKRRIWIARGGRCLCGVEVPMFGKGVTYEHHHQLAMDGPEDDDNVWPKCDDCTRKKNKADAQARAKVKRLIEKSKPPGERKPKRGRQLKGPGFQKGHRPIQSRPFSRRR